MPMPYELRSPEDIAKEYGGNKQKIGAAVQSGLLDPTAGVLAGMFIDRMRNAVVEEQSPATTVAQDIMSPRPAPAAPAGLAAMPQQAIPAPGAGAVPAGPAMPQGMARGGLTSLNVPDTMYDYAGGGIIAFAEGDEVEERLRIRPVDSLAEAYVFLQERGAEIPEDMSEEAIINYANRVREMESMEVRDAGARVSPEAALGEVQTGFPALFRDYGSGGRGDLVPETRLDATPQMPMEDGEFAPGFSPVAPTERGLPGLMAPEGPAPERAVPFLGQMMENIVPSAQAAEPVPPAQRGMAPTTTRGLDPEFVNAIRAANGMPPIQVTTPDVIGEAVDAALINQLPARTAAPAPTPTPTTGLGAITPQASVDRAARSSGMGLTDADKALALTEFGARMMAGTSPYALQNIGTAGVGTLQSMREVQKARIAASKEKDTDFRRQLEILTNRRMRENPDLTKDEAEAMAYDDYVAAETSIQAGRLEAQRERYAQQGRVDISEELRKWESGLSLSDPKVYAQMLRDPEFAAQKRAEKRAELEGRAAPAPTMAAAPGAGKTPPNAAVAELKSNPSELRRKQFDQVYGAGAAARVLGG